MSAKKIFTIGAQELRMKANPIKRFDARLDLIFRDMAQTMYDAQGCGLAAPQIGILRRLIVLDVGEGLIEMVNPEITASEGSCGLPEGCLSIPGRRGFVTRPEKVTVVAQNRTGMHFTMQAEGLLARAIQHEIDHLDGVLYVDKMDYEILEEEDGEEETVKAIQKKRGRAV